MAGTLYFLLTKQVPPNASFRNLDEFNPDTLKPLKNLVPNISDRVNYAVMKGLSFYAKDRPQTVEEFLKLLIPDYNPGGDQGNTESDRSLKKPLLLGILGAMLISIVGFSYFKFLASPKFVDINLFEPQKGKIKLIYPEEWKVEREPITNELGKFISPQENDSDTFQESLIVSVEGSDLSLEQYTEKTLQQINQNITRDTLNIVMEKIRSLHRVLRIKKLQNIKLFY